MPALYYWGAVLLALSPAWAATPIGSVRPNGPVTLDGKAITSSTPFSANATVETKDSSSSLTLSDGVKIQIRAHSRIQVWDNHLLLERGGVEVAGTYVIEATGIKVHMLDSARATVELKEKVIVSTALGLARVQNLQGLVLEFVPAGKTAGFALGSVNSVGESRTGCMVYKESRFFLQDDATAEIIELQGPDLDLNVGNRVVVIGRREGAVPLNVSSVSPLSQGGCLTLAITLGASTKAPDKTKSRP